MFKSTSSNAELLVDNDLRFLLQPHRRSVKTPVIVAVVIVVALVMAVTVGVACKRRHPKATTEPPQHPVDARLAAAHLRFNSSWHGRNTSNPGQVDLAKHGGMGDDYGELDKI